MPEYTFVKTRGDGAIPVLGVYLCKGADDKSVRLEMINVATGDFNTILEISGEGSLKRISLGENWAKEAGIQIDKTYKIKMEEK